MDRRVLRVLKESKGYKDQKVTPENKDQKETLLLMLILPQLSLLH